jgi:hypothetical protein
MADVQRRGRKPEVRAWVLIIFRLLQRCRYQDQQAELIREISAPLPDAECHQRRLVRANFLHLLQPLAQLHQLRIGAALEQHRTGDHVPFKMSRDIA